MKPKQNNPKPPQPPKPAERMLPADTELRKFMETGGRPDARHSFDELLERAAKPK